MRVQWHKTPDKYKVSVITTQQPEYAQHRAVDGSTSIHIRLRIGNNSLPSIIVWFGRLVCLRDGESQLGKLHVWMHFRAGQLCLCSSFSLTTCSAWWSGLLSVCWNCLELREWAEEVPGCSLLIVQGAPPQKFNCCLRWVKLDFMLYTFPKICM